MKIKEIEKRKFVTNGNLQKSYLQFDTLLNELRKRDLPEEMVHFINNSIDEITATSLSGYPLGRFIKKKQTAITQRLEKQLKIVPKNYYQNLWMVLGMSGIGLPIGVAFATSIGNIGMLGVGLPIGMVIGLGIGAGMDNKAKKEGRQLDLEIKN